MDRKIRIGLILLLVISAVVRGLIAGCIELGNDEVYYLTYARFPDLSHFDHPPMVGLVIQLFTLNLALTHEFFIRLAAVVFGTLSTWLIFLVGRQVKDDLTGFYAALLYTASFYGFILAGTFILPDAPQVSAWLLVMYALLKSLPDRELRAESRRWLLLAGLAAGFALLSKYHSVFLVAGAFLYMVFYNRRWFLAKETWMALGLVVISCVPVFLWNYQYDFISFTYHENRITLTESGVQLQYLVTELAGEFFYNNPVSVILILFSMASLILGHRFINRPSLRLILLLSLPLLFVFISFSLFRRTLPHWTGPAYLGFIVIAAARLSERGKMGRPRPLIPWQAGLALGFMLTVAGLAVSQIRTGWIPLSRWKMEDVTHDLTGWRQLGGKFPSLARRYEQAGLINPGAPILTFRWFPAANLDYYVGTPAGNPVYALGSLERIHKYHWINIELGNLPLGQNAWYLALSDDYGDPAALYGHLFDSVTPPDTLVITRKYDTVRRVYAYRLIGLKQALRFPSRPDGVPAP